MSFRSRMVGCFWGCSALLLLSSSPSPALPASDTTTDSKGQLRLVVDRSEKTLTVYQGPRILRTESVAIGKSGYATPTGHWRIWQIDWNPDWNPPPGRQWAENKKPKKPGEPGNPMGRVRFLFKPPYMLHGTEEHGSLGGATSHGCIRLSNEAAIRLGKLLMESGAANQDESWLDETLKHPSVMRSVPLPKPIPIEVRD